MSFYISLPNCLCPFFQPSQTTFVYPFVCSFLCLPKPGDLSTCQNTFYPLVSHYTTTIPPSCHFSPALPSPLLSLPRSHYHREQHFCFVKSSSFTTQVSLPQRTTLQLCQVLFFHYSGLTTTENNTPALSSPLLSLLRSHYHREQHFNFVKSSSFTTQVSLPQRTTLQLCQVLFFHYSGLTTTENNTSALSSPLLSLPRSHYHREQHFNFAKSSSFTTQVSLPQRTTLQLCQVLFFHYPGLTTTENNTSTLSSPLLSLPRFHYHREQHFNFAKSSSFTTQVSLPQRTTLQLCQVLFFHYSGLTTTENNTSTLPSPLLSLPRSHYHREQHSSFVKSSSFTTQVSLPQRTTLQLCQVLFFHYPGLTTTENNTPALSSPLLSLPRSHYHREQHF